MNRTTYTPILLVLFFLLFQNQAKAQSPLYSIDSELRVMFSSLYKPTPHPNFLFEMAAHVIDSSFFKPRCSDTINYDTWNKMYEEMRASAYDTTIMLPAQTVFYNSLHNRSDTLNLNVMAYNYYKFIDTALTTSTYFFFDTVNNVLTDKSIDMRPGYPYWTDTVFAVSPVKNSIPYNSIIYRIDPAFIFNDAYNPIDMFDNKLWIDFGDGVGFRLVNTATVNYFTVTYSVSGEHVITAKILSSMGIVKKLSKSILMSTARIAPPAPDGSYSNSGLTASIWDPCTESGGPIKKYIIYVKGYDPVDFLPGMSRYSSDIYQEQIVQTGLSQLRNFGYSFIVVNWNQSGRKIEDNAMDLVKLIRQVKCWIAASDHPDEQIVVMGESMGALVSRYALAYMENYTDAEECMPEKMHDCRLFISLDGPNTGANIPLAYQQFYRDPLGIHVIQPLLTAGELLFGSMFGILIDAPAVQEMLIYHVDTHNPITDGYSSHFNRASFDANLSALGYYPKYCKMMGMSNGSLAGKAQTRNWDGGLRSPGDQFVSASYDGYVNILWQKIKILGANYELHSVPDGHDLISFLEAGTWAVHLHVYWFGINLRVSLSSMIAHYNYGLTDGIDVAPGSTDYTVNQYGGMLKSILLLGSRGRDAGGGKTIGLDLSFGGKFFGGGLEGSVTSDGFNYCFIPTISALDFTHDNYYDNIEGMSVSTAMGKTPFDVITGITEDYPYFDDGLPGYINTHKYNREHLDLRNDILGDFRTSAGITTHYNGYYYYPACTGDYLLMRFLNREIGDDTLLVESRTLPWRGMYDAENHIGVNERSSLYTYPSSTTSVTIPGIYASEDPLTVSGGQGDFYAKHRDVSIYSAYLYGIGDTLSDSLDWHECCADYGYKPPKHSQLGISQNPFIVYPNPSTGNFIVAFAAQKDLHGRIEIYDIVGKMLVSKDLQIDKDGDTKIQVDMGNKLAPGTYMLVLRNGANMYKQVLAIQ